MDAIASSSIEKLTPARSRGCRVHASSIATFLVALLGAQQLLLWAFLGLHPWLIGAGALSLTGFSAMFRRFARRVDATIDLRLVAANFAISIVIFALGGEGRFFYANADWQVRNAVLHDLVTYSWPFAYAMNGQVDILRAPLGLYLVPALAGKAGGLRLAELAMLLQSAAVLTCVLSLASALFDTHRERLVAFAVFFAFSGMDILGMAAAGGWLGIHLEGWGPLQYSSHVTQAFWVPMHALAGWMGAALFLLWQRGRAPLAAFLTPLPLLAILSPLALIGIVPFAAYAGIATLSSRSLRPIDVLAPLATSLFSGPSLLYLASGSGSVGGHPNPINFAQWAVFIAIEVLAFLVATVIARRHSAFGPRLPLFVALLLLAFPCGQIGSATDFTMRASIPALAILAILVAEFLMRVPASLDLRVLQAIVLAALAIGLATPLTEVAHAVGRPRQPLTNCSYFGVVPHGAPTYVARLNDVSPAIRPAAPTVVSPKDPPSCKEITWLDAERRFRSRRRRAISFF